MQLVTICGLFICPWVLAADSNSVVVTGILENGPCRGTLVLRSSTNAYEFSDSTKLNLKVGDRVLIHGIVYPKISRCKVYSWLEAKNVTVDDSNATGALESLPTLNAKRTLAPNAKVILVSTLQDLSVQLTQARSLKKRMPASVNVTVGVLATQRQLLPQLYNVTKQDFNLMNGVQIEAIEGRQPKSVIVLSNDNESTYKDIQSFLGEQSNAKENAS